MSNFASGQEGLDALVLNRGARRLFQTGALLASSNFASRVRSRASVQFNREIMA